MMLRQHVITRIFQLKQTRDCTTLYNPELVTAITREKAPEPIKNKNDGSPAGKSGDIDPPLTPAAKAKGQTMPEQGSGAKRTGRKGQPPKKKKKKH